MIDPVSTLHSRYYTALQNSPYTSVFCLTFVSFTVLTGAFIPLALAFVVALLASFAYQMIALPPRAVPGQLAVLITGAGTGLGFDMAVRLAGLGVTVYAGVWEVAEGTRLVEAAGGGGRVVPMVLDVTKQADIDAAVAITSRDVNAGKHRLYALLSNAGYGAHAPIELLPLDRLRANFEVNAFAVVRLTQALLPLLRKGASEAAPSHIVITSSMNGRLSSAGKTAYCASKHAVEAIGDNLRTELHRWHVRTTLLEPGFFDTGIASSCRKHTEAIFAECDSDDAVQQRVPADLMAHYKCAMQQLMKPLFPQAIGQVTDAVVQALFRPEAPARLLVGWDGFLTFLLELIPDYHLDRNVAAKGFM